MKKEDVIQRIRETAQSVLPADARLILFGSQARGDARQDSDWDLLLLIDKDSRITNADFDRFAYPLVDLGWTINEEINPLIYTFHDWEKRKFTPLYKNVETEGVELLCR